jgi:hypothetical protein
VILFLLVTSMLNIALGYGLAIYLAKCSGAAGARRDDSVGNPGADALASIAQRTDGSVVTWPAGATAAALGSGPPTPAKNDTAAELPHEDNEVQSRTAAMEQDLLAGIEEFRNQLAQLKSKGSVSFEAPATT